MPKITDIASCLKFLDECGIHVRELRHHEAAHTIEDFEKYCEGISGLLCKNLLVKDEKKRLWLVIAEAHTPIEMKKLSKTLAGNTSMRFGTEQMLMDNLGARPGSVNPFAIINDEAGKVQLVVDSKLVRHQGSTEPLLLNFHPMENTATCTITDSDLLRYFDIAKHQPVFLDFDAVNAMVL
jgi:Ala-tRNA(Pro) deacylase